MIGDALERTGWRQGSVLADTDTPLILSHLSESYSNTASLVFIVASQSCDIANNNIQADPFIELSIGRIIPKQEGNNTYNKNPRLLHTSLNVHDDEPGDSQFRLLFLELKAYEKVQILKDTFKDLKPDRQRKMTPASLDSYILWLSSRYSRPALPTEFNDRIVSADPKDKLRKKAKAFSESLSGIYVEIIPFAEIAKDEVYQVNLLGLVSPAFTGDISKLQDALEQYAQVMNLSNMNVIAAVRSEADVSLATIKRFRRFYYDDLSFKSSTELPPEIVNNL